jgi:hypothetical protein
MSVSEKLKALEVECDEGSDSQLVDLNEQRRAGELLDALPQIVAVVEAAEITSVWPESEGWTREEVSNMQAYGELQAALAALEEALP